MLLSFRQALIPTYKRDIISKQTKAAHRITITNVKKMGWVISHTTIFILHIAPNVSNYRYI